MTYFNGGGGGSWLGVHDPFIATTAIYCDPCAETAIPLPATGRNGDAALRHSGTGFKWAPRYGGGATCVVCGKPS